MGLDMYAMTTVEAVPSEVDFSAPENCQEIHYWRKHPNLHGWMEQLYRAKGGRKESFNCVPVVLSAEDLDQLEADIRNNALPATEGFFFGASDGSETEDDLAFIAKARKEIAAGNTVIYDSWW